MSLFDQVVLTVVWVAGNFAVPAILIWGWTRWARTPTQPGIVVQFSFFGFVLASSSGVLAVSSIAYAHVIHGFAYYDPRLLRIFRIGFLLSLAALVSAIVGVARPNSLRRLAPLSAFATLSFWTAAASGE